MQIRRIIGGLCMCYPFRYVIRWALVGVLHHSDRKYMTNSKEEEKEGKKKKKTDELQIKPVGQLSAVQDKSIFKS